MKRKDIYLYDSTLRDGEQAEGVAFSLQDKVRMAHKLDTFGIDYIEGGYPGSNPKSIQFFDQMKKEKLTFAKLTAFGSTRHARSRTSDDVNIRALIKTRAPVMTIFGKSWDFHVKDALRVSLTQNLKMIADSVKYLKSKGREVIYDAEHFFDGFKANPEYAIKTLLAAAEAGADNITLCDTNGGSLFSEVREIIETVKKVIDLPLGIHAHNDGGLGVANSLAAVECGVTLVQGTINGYGERCGNADLIQIISSLELKYQKRCVPKRSLPKLVELSRFVAEMANVVPEPRQPYVGRSVFTHKGGIHVSAILRNPDTYEHIKPELVGNRRRVVVSEQSGKSNLAFKAEEYGVDLEQLGEIAPKVLENIKQLEHEGYEFEAAEGSLDLNMQRAMGKYRRFFDLEGFRVIIEKRGNHEPCVSEATIKVNIEGESKHTAAEGDGPVNALDTALRKALIEAYPDLKNVQLSDFKVRIIDSKAGTAAKVRVLIESTDGESEWGTVGVSENIIEASWQALVDSIEYKLLQAMKKKKSKKR